MDDRLYWIWLQQVLKYANNKIRTVKIIYDNAENFYNAGEHSWKMCGCFSSKEISFMKSYDINKAATILDKCINLGYNILTFDSQEYPERLKNISSPPCVLYVKGKLPAVDNKICISIVGTRSATLYGVQMSFDIALELAKSGTIVVSGGAVGIDESSHKGAIQGKGKTIAVLGCGINYPYLMQNASLRDAISGNGAVISEFAPDFPSYPANFPMRNRIISGLSLGTVVIEAGKKSGSLITASFAIEQNRDVFAVPVDMNSSVSEGTTALIRDGAKVVTCAEDILSEYRTNYFRENDFDSNDTEIIFERPTKYNYEMKVTDNQNYLFCNNTDIKLKRQSNNEKNTKEEVNKSKYLEKEIKLSLEEKIVYDILQKGKMHIDLIAVKSKIPIKNLLPIMTSLELQGFICIYAGKFYGVKN